jgi:hypothetical protein
MDAYDLYQKIQKYWQNLVPKNSGSTAKKTWELVPVYVDNRLVKDVIVKDNRIIIITE